MSIRTTVYCDHEGAPVMVTVDSGGGELTFVPKAQALEADRDCAAWREKAEAYRRQVGGHDKALRRCRQKVADLEARVAELEGRAR